MRVRYIYIYLINDIFLIIKHVKIFLILKVFRSLSLLPGVKIVIADKNIEVKMYKMLQIFFTCVKNKTKLFYTGKVNF